MRLAVPILVFLATIAHAGNVRDVTLMMPHHLNAGEALSLEIVVGSIPRGSEIEITGASGRTLGTISPYGIRSGQEAGVYTVPLPSDVVSNDRVRIRLSIIQYGQSERAPTSDEVKQLRLKTKALH